jgi:hypothetical protein
VGLDGFLAAAFGTSGDAAMNGNLNEKHELEQDRSDGSESRKSAIRSALRDKSDPRDCARKNRSVPPSCARKIRFSSAVARGESAFHASCAGKIRLPRTFRTTQSSRNAPSSVAEIQHGKTRFSHTSRIAAPSV